MNKLWTDTSCPRRSAGEISAMYMGTTALAAPTAAPTTDRPSTIVHTLVAADWDKAPKMNIPHAAAMTGRRPMTSAKCPAKGDEIRASKEVLLVIAERSKVDNGRPRSSWMETRVELITPVLFEDSVQTRMRLWAHQYSLITKQ